MKHINIVKKFAALAAASALLCVPARAQVAPTSIFVLTNNIPASITTNTTVIISGTFNPVGGAWQPTNNIIYARQGQGAAASSVFAGTNSSCTLGLNITWAISLDGTNWAISQIPLNGTASGTNTVTAWTNYSNLLLNNALYISPYSIQNANTAGNCGINIAGITVSFGNIVPSGY